MTRNIGHGMRVSIGGKMNGDYFTAATGNFGTFQVEVDSIPPTIVPLFNSSADSIDNHIAFMLLDNLTRIKDYSATINGKWFLMEFDKKSNTLSATLPLLNSENELEFQLIVHDELDNETIFRKKLRN
jgi:hypothetical protein